MENKKKFSLEVSEVPDFLRGFSSLVLMAQNDDFDISSATFFAISTILEYVADDLEGSLDSLCRDRSELYRLQEQSEASKNVSFPILKADSDDQKDKAFFKEIAKEAIAR